MHANSVLASRNLCRIGSTLDQCRDNYSVTGLGAGRGRDKNLVANCNVRVFGKPLVDRDRALRWMLDQQQCGEEVDEHSSKGSGRALVGGRVHVSERLDHHLCGECRTYRKQSAGDSQVDWAFVRSFRDNDHFRARNDL